MKFKIEATGNTREEAEHKLRLMRAQINAQQQVYYKIIDVYGNFETGYKLVQDYETAL